MIQDNSQHFHNDEDKNQSAPSPPSGDTSPAPIASEDEVSHPPGTNAESELEAYVDAVSQALTTFLNSNTWGEKRSVLEREQELLLTDTAERIILILLDDKQQNSDTNQREADLKRFHLLLHLAVMQDARQKGIPAAWAALEAEIRRAEQGQKSTLEENEQIQRDGQEEGVDQDPPLTWFTILEPRKGRQFLEKHLELLDPEVLDTLERGFVEFQRSKGTTSEHLRDQLNLLHDAYRYGGTREAVRRAYVDLYGGFALDGPHWLEEVERQFYCYLSHTQRCTRRL